MDNFNSFKLPVSIEKALVAMKFHSPTPIQCQAIPIALSGKDLVGCAQTGTGKTAAFCIPVLVQLLNHSNKNTALILVPTRELAVQIDTFWKKITQFNVGINSAVIIGGIAMKPQMRALARQPRLIIATPGRLLDHLRSYPSLLSKVSILVLDEADRMLDMGFKPQLTQILQNLPAHRQTLFFTATWASELDQLAKKYLRNPSRVTIGTSSCAASQINQSIIMTTAHKKNEALLDELNRCPGSVLVFARTKSRTDRVARYLAEYGVEVNRLHGGRTQGQRSAALSAFRNGKARVLIATDIAARGIDIAKIGHVINYDLPQSSEDYIHRIGRTGRAGETGQAISLLTSEDRQQWRQISKLLVRSGSQMPKLPNEVSEIEVGASPFPSRSRKVKNKGQHQKRRKEVQSWRGQIIQKKLSENKSKTGSELC